MISSLHSGVFTYEHSGGLHHGFRLPFPGQPYKADIVVHEQQQQRLTGRLVRSEWLHEPAGVAHYFDIKFVVVVAVVVVVEVAFEGVEQAQVLEPFAVGAVGSSVESAHLAAAAVVVAVVLAEGLPVAQQVPTLRLAQHTSFYQFVVV